MFPLFYYLSYLLANPGGGHRYVYPAIIILQIYSIIILFRNILGEWNTFSFLNIK